MLKNKYLMSISFLGAVVIAATASNAQSPRMNSDTSTNAINNFAVAAANNSYADVADLVVAAPLIVDVTIRKLTKVQPQQAVGVPANMQRIVIDADVNTLLRGVEGIGAKVRFLLDVPLNEKGKLPALKKQRFFLFANKVSNMPGTIRLVRPNALAEWSVSNDSLVRMITREAVQLDAPQAITGVTSAFHSVGAIPGEGDSQIFMSASGGQPYSISVASRAGQPKRWTVSTSELIEDSASAPKRNTLLWYRLACGLPPVLGADQLEASDADNAARIRADYAFVLSSLGKCDRTRR